MSEGNEVRGRCQKGMRCGEVSEGNEVRWKCRRGMRCKIGVRGE